MINQTGLVAANNIAFLLSLLTAQAMADQAVWPSTVYLVEIDHILIYEALKKMQNALSCDFPPSHYCFYDNFQ